MSNYTEQQADKAKSLLTWYFRLALEGNGTHWDGDNAGEVADIIDHIVNACTPEEPAQPDALTRIAVALERIAERLDGFSDSLAEDALRVYVLR